MSDDDALPMRWRDVRSCANTGNRAVGQLGCADFDGWRWRNAGQNHLSDAGRDNDDHFINVIFSKLEFPENIIRVRPMRCDGLAYKLLYKSP